METIGSRIRAVRKHLKKTQTEFAESLGLNHAIVSIWELDRIEIAEKNIKAICYTFKVNDKWLRTGQGKMFIEEYPLKSELFSIFDELESPLQDTLITYAKGLLAAQYNLSNYKKFADNQSEYSGEKAIHPIHEQKRA
jgi:transcriptional regulator with XRE-family HTH domain